MPYHLEKQLLEPQKHLITLNTEKQEMVSKKLPKKAGSYTSIALFRTLVLLIELCVEKSGPQAQRTHQTENATLSPTLSAF